MSYYYLQSNELYHHGILGMRWGIRRFQPYPKGHRGGKEVGEAAKAKTDRKEGPSKVKIAAEKIKKVVKTPEFQTAAIVVGMGAAAAVGTAFIASPVGKALLGTSVRAATNIALSITKPNKVETAVMKQAADTVNTIIENPATSDIYSVGTINKTTTANSKLYDSAARAAMKVASTSAEDLTNVMQSDKQLTEGSMRILSKVAEKYATDAQLTGEQIQKGMEMAQKFKV